jgi:hypothetical protein
MASFGTIGIGTIGARLSASHPVSVLGEFPELIPKVSRHIVMQFIPRNADNVGIV